MKKQSTLLIIAAALLTACSENNDKDYCGKHQLHHSGHADRIGELHVRYTEDGVLDARLKLPYVALWQDGGTGDDEAALSEALGVLEHPEQVFAVRGNAVCRERQTNIQQNRDGLEAHYVFDCGPDNRLENVDIRLLEHLPTIEEIEADIETPAVRKTFLINQQCSNAIYNY